MNLYETILVYDVIVGQNRNIVFGKTVENRQLLNYRQFRHINYIFSENSDQVKHVMWFIGSCFILWRHNRKTKNAIF